MSRQSRRRREKQKQTVGVTVGVIAGAALLILLALGERGVPELDSDGCPAEEAPAEQIVVLLDPSDALSPVQHRSALPRLIEALEPAPEAAEIRIYTVANAGRRVTGPSFRTCKPTHPDDENSMTGNPDLAADAYDAWFTTLERRMRDMVSVPGDTASPIVEAIQFAAVDAFLPRAAAIPRRLLIISDMVQHSADLSFFRDRVDFGSFSRNSAYGTLRVDLTRVRVDAFLLARRGEAGQIQAGTLRTFWEDYFLDQRAAATARPRWVEVEG